MPGEQARGAGITLSLYFPLAMLQYLDHFRIELKVLNKTVEKVTKVFSVVQPKSLVVAAKEEL